MNRIAGLRWWFFGVAGGVLAALWLAPSTGWILRSNVGGGYHALTPWLERYSLEEREPPPAEQARRGKLARILDAAARKRPRDYPIQLANALFQAELASGLYALSGPPLVARDSFTPRDASLRTLLGRFGDDPRLYADILRFGCQGPWLTVRKERYLLDGMRIPKEFAEYRRPTEHQVQAFLRTAQEGERLDPDNAFFPIMEVLAEYQTGNDGRAHAALMRAASKRRWDDYVTAEPEGRTYLVTAAVGEIGAMRRIVLLYSTLFPHFSRIRAAERIAIYDAMQKERAGLWAEGAETRLAFQRLGVIIRDQSRSAVGALVGIAVARLSLARPGGAAPYRGAVSSPDSERTAQERLRAFARRLRSLRMSREATLMEQGLADQDEADRRLRRIIAPQRMVGAAVPSAMAEMATLASSVSLLWMLLLTVLAVIAARSGRVRAGQSMSWPQRLGLTWACASLLVVAVDSAWRWHAEGLTLLRYAVLGLPWLAVVLGFLNAAWRNALRGWMVSATTGALACSGLYVATLPVARQMAECLSILASLLGHRSVHDLASDAVGKAMFASLHPLLFVPAILALMTPVLARRRVPLSVSYPRTLSSVGPLIVLLLTLIYGGYVVRRGRFEEGMASQLKAAARNEVQWYARQAGEPWPIRAAEMR